MVSARDGKLIQAAQKLAWDALNGTAKVAAPAIKTAVPAVATAAGAGASVPILLGVGAVVAVAGVGYGIYSLFDGDKK